MPLADSFRSLLSPAALLRLAGEVTMDRGRRYHAEGRVSGVAERDGEVTAQVAGTEPYRVRLWDAGGTLGFDCSCPVGDDLRFCKHCVAVALSCTGAEGTGPAEAAAPSPRRRDPRQELREYLQRQDPAALVEMLVEHAEVDDRLRNRLRLRAAAHEPEAGRAKSFRSALDRAFRTGDFVDYAQAGDYAAGILDVIGEMRALLDVAPGDLVTLAEHAMRRAEEAIQDVDDSDGHFGEIFAALADLHLEACLRARPDPVALAGRLFQHAMQTDYDGFHGVAAYVEALGPPGLAAYRARAEEAWAAVPPLDPGDRDRPRATMRSSLTAAWDAPGLDLKRYRITQVMESLAAATGGVEALVEVKRRDLSTSYHFLEIAETYRKAGNHAQAVQWAEDGLAAFPGRPDGRLRDFLAAEYQRAGRHDEALELMWAEFTDAPGLDRYKKLHGHASAAGAWPEWRERALAHLRQHAARSAPTRGSYWPGDDTGYSAIVRILLWERRVEDAWRAAGEGGCSEDLWFQLAREREGEHPGDAVPIYQRRIEAQVSNGSNQGYETAVRLLGRLRDLWAKAGREPAEFAEWVAVLRGKNHRKRNFIKLLDTARLA